ncbi:hypothetical protein [Paenarthrobacter histidinolovorans]|uniref:hypothetical protein n=1 Tax=Paenarthrobacter histidinolovorans TaxID=43664 RepID=UPI001668DAF5|nr:hypothetical protein [Paenarthrobacter histidinolovorans]GGJ15658.1 hypothetical protein GCM10010052_11310 [Paenarthrobacter histidinolovorans]
MATFKPGLRKALLAGGIAVTLTGAGGAAVWAGTQPGPSPSSPSATPSPSATAKAGSAAASDKAGSRAIHGEHVVKQQDGSFRTVLTQAGTIDSVSGPDITVKSEDGFTQRYAITTDTRITRIPADLSQLRNGNGKSRPELPSATAADLKAGDKVHISGTKDGDTVSATRIVVGELPAGLKGGYGLKGGHGLMGGHRVHGPKQTTEPQS